MEQGAYDAGRKETYSIKDDIYWNYIEPLERAMRTKTPLAAVWTEFQGQKCVALETDGGFRPFAVLPFWGTILDTRFQCGDPKLEAEFQEEHDKLNEQRRIDNEFMDKVCKMIDIFNTKL